MDLSLKHKVYKIHKNYRIGSAQSNRKLAATAGHWDPQRPTLSEITPAVENAQIVDKNDKNLIRIRIEGVEDSRSSEEDSSSREYSAKGCLEGPGLRTLHIRP